MNNIHTFIRQHIQLSSIVALSVLGAGIAMGPLQWLDIQKQSSSASSVLVASPNPIKICGRSTTGSTTLSWVLGNASQYELYSGSYPGGTLMQSGTGSGQKLVTDATNGSIYSLVSVTVGSGWQFVKGRWIKVPQEVRSVIGLQQLVHTTEGCNLSSSLTVEVLEGSRIAPGQSYILRATNSATPFSGAVDVRSVVCSSLSQCNPANVYTPWAGVVFDSNGRVTVPTSTSIPTALYKAQIRPAGQITAPWSNEFMITVEASPSVGTTNPIDVNKLRSVTYWHKLNSTTDYDWSKVLGCSDTFTSELEAQIPRMKETGFNAVWLIPWWHCFSPGYIYPDTQYDAQAFARLRNTLDMLKRNNMKAILSLTYIAGFSHTNYGPCDILAHRDNQGRPTGYWTIRDYYTRYLTEIQNYSSDVIILLHSEGLICNGSSPFRTIRPSDAELVRNTIGRLPWDLPPALRQKFIMGFHDWAESITENGRGEVTGQTATMPKGPDGKIPWDFASEAFYDPTMPQFGQYSFIDLDERIQKKRNYYGQDVKFFHGELGSGSCYYSWAPGLAGQQLYSIVRHALSKGRGVNIWEWIGVDCGPGDTEFKLHEKNGSPLPTYDAVKRAFSDYPL